MSKFTLLRDSLYSLGTLIDRMRHFFQTNFITFCLNNKQIFTFINNRNVNVNSYRIALFIALYNHSGRVCSVLKCQTVTTLILILFHNKLFLLIRVWIQYKLVSLVSKIKKILTINIFNAVCLRKLAKQCGQNICNKKCTIKNAQCIHFYANNFQFSDFPFPI